MTRREHAAQLLGDYPTALRFRWRAARAWSVPPEFQRGSGRPVVVLPGIYESWHYLRPIAEHLNAAGHPVHVLPRLGRNGRPIPATAADVAQELRERELRGVAIVAHSKGGIVGKYLLAIDERGDDTERRIERVIAIASPFGGSSMARFVPVGGLREFRTDAPLLGRLAAEREVNSRITSIYPSFDPHVPQGSWLDGAHNIELPVVGHFRILLDPELPGIVQAEVERL